MNRINKANRRFQLELKLATVRIIKNFKRFKAENQFIIFSDPRGGSTWMSEMLKTIPNTAMIWEPFNIKYVNQFKKINFGWRQYIPENASWPEAYQVIQNALAGKVINEWTMLKTEFLEYIKADHLIIKICRGNMILPWITLKFNFKYPPIYLIRHPFAVVSSQIKQGGWNYSFKKFNVPNIPYNEIYKDHEAFLCSLTTKEEILTAYWCITNQIPLTHAMNNLRWITIYYENLLLNPEEEIHRILKRWKVQVPSEIYEKSKILSSTSLAPIELGNPERQIGKWKNELNRDQIIRMGKVLNYFNIKEYSPKDEKPLVNSDKE